MRPLMDCPSVEAGEGRGKGGEEEDALTGKGWRGGAEGKRSDRDSSFDC